MGGERPGAGGRRLGRAPREEAAGPRGFLLRSFPPPLLSTHAFLFRSKVVGLGSLGGFCVRDFSPPTPSPEKKVLFASSGGRLQVEVLVEAVS